MNPVKAQELKPLAARWCGYCQRGLTDCACPPWMPNTGTDEERKARGERQDAEREQSDEPGAWTCGACGFRGFWRGGPHCTPVGVTNTEPPRWCGEIGHVEELSEDE